MNATLASGLSPGAFLRGMAAIREGMTIGANCEASVVTVGKDVPGQRLGPRQNSGRGLVTANDPKRGFAREFYVKRRIPTLAEPPHGLGKIADPRLVLLDTTRPPRTARPVDSRSIRIRDKKKFTPGGRRDDKGSPHSVSRFAFSWRTGRCPMQIISDRGWERWAGMEELPGWRIVAVGVVVVRTPAQPAR